MKIIKRYANRRLYDSDTSRTITLEEVANFVRQGEEIKVIDNITQEDITSKVLGQTFLKINDSGKNEPLINFILTALIRESGEGFLNMVKKLVFSGIGMAQLPTEEREGVLKALVKLEDSATDEHKDLFLGLARKGQQEADKFWESITTTMDDVAQKIQRSFLTTIEPLERSQTVETLTKQIEEMAKKLAQFGNKEESADGAAEEKADKA